MAGPRAVAAAAWPEPKVHYWPARTVGIGQARRWSTLSELSRVKQERFTI